MKGSEVKLYVFQPPSRHTLLIQINYKLLKTIFITGKTENLRYYTLNSFVTFAFYKILFWCSNQGVCMLR